MVNKPGKPKSKRVPVRLRHKIEKAGAAKDRKQRKLAKKNPEWRSRLKKDPGIPNLFPYKDKILHEIEEKKRLKAEEALKKGETQKKGTGYSSIADQSEANDHDDEEIEDALSDLLDEESMDEAEAGNSNPMAALLESARARASEHHDHAHEREVDAMDDSNSDVEMEDPSASNGTYSKGRTIDPSTKSFTSAYKGILQNSDIILYVLDARDPEGTRSKEIEKEILSSGNGSKRLILVLNKIDLVPPNILEVWLKYLRRYFPTVPLRANSPAPNAKIFDHKALTVRGTSETLLRALKSYAHSQNPRGSTTVGIVGFPNVGKSSVINALTSRLGSSKASKIACPVGAEAGVTRSLRQVKLDNKLKLLDSPGIVFNTPLINTTFPRNLTQKQVEKASLILLGALPPSSIEDPVPSITLLLHRSAASSVTINPIMDYYGINASTLRTEDGDMTTDFLLQVARKRGRLGKGGVPNLDAAAMGVLADWRDGRIRGWNEPPPPVPDSNGNVASDNKTIVQEWSKEFKLDGLWGEDTDEQAENDMEQ